MDVSNLVYFSAAWIIGVYLINCIFAREIKKIDVRMALLYVTTVAMIGTFGEIFWDTLYDRIFGIPLWEYYIYPIHDGHTSIFASALWGFYGFHLYLLYDTIRTRYPAWSKHLTWIFSFEALVIEALVSLTFLWAFGTWLYYYLPGELWHVSTVQNFPLYIMAGYVITRTLKRFSKDPVFFSLMNIALIVVIVFLVS